MKITLNEDGSFLVKLEPEELESLKEVQELFKDCSEKFDEKASLKETLKQVIEAGICWLSE